MSDTQKNFKRLALETVRIAASGTGNQPLNDALRNIEHGVPQTGNKSLSPHQREALRHQTAASLNNIVRRYLVAGDPGAAIHILGNMAGYPHIFAHVWPECIGMALSLTPGLPQNLGFTRSFGANIMKIARIIADSGNEKLRAAFTANYAAVPEELRTEIMGYAEDMASRATIMMLSGAVAAKPGSPGGGQPAPT